MSSQNLKRLSLIIVVIAAVIAIFAIKRGSTDAGLEGDSAPTINPQWIHDSDARDGPRLPRLVELGAHNCVPCLQMIPVLESLHRDFAGQFDIEFIHVYREEEKAAPYRIRLMPTQVLLDEEGREIFRHEGFFSRSAILEKWRELGYDFVPGKGGTESPGDASLAGAAEGSDSADGLIGGQSARFEWIPTELPLEDEDLARLEGMRFEVLYLHPTLRCEVCLAAEMHAVKALETYMPFEVESGLIVWRAIDYESQEGRLYAERFAIETGSGSFLILAERFGDAWGHTSRLKRILDVAEDFGSTAGYLVFELHTFIQDSEALAPALEITP